MKTIWSNIKQMRIGRNIIEFTMWLAVAYIMVYLLEFAFPPTGAYSQFPATVLRGMLGAGMFMYVLKTNFTGFTLKQIIEEKNLPAAIIALSFALIIAAVITTS